MRLEIVVFVTHAKLFFWHNVETTFFRNDVRNMRRNLDISTLVMNTTHFGAQTIFNFLHLLPTN